MISSAGGLPDGLQELAATMQLDAEATIRVDIAGGKADHALSETLPRLSVAPGTGADLEVLELLGQGGMGQVRLARHVGVAIAAMCVNRAVAMIAQPPFEYMLGVDLFLIGVIAAIAGATVDKWFYLAAIIWTLGFVGIVVFSQVPMLPYAISQIGGLVVLAVAFYRRGGGDDQRSSS